MNAQSLYDVPIEMQKQGGPYLVVCWGQEQDREFRKALKRRVRSTYKGPMTSALTMRYTDMDLESDHIFYWRGEGSPTDHPTVQDWTRLTGGMTILLPKEGADLDAGADLIAVELRKRARTQLRNLRHLMRRYPWFQWEVSRNEYWGSITARVHGPTGWRVRARVKGRWRQVDSPSCTSPVHIEDPERAIEQLNRWTREMGLWMSLNHTYHNLYLSVSMASKSGPDEKKRWVTTYGPEFNISVWARKTHPYSGMPDDGSATGVHLRTPLTDADHALLAALDVEAGKARENGMFFCTECRTAKTRETDYCHFHFAATVCKDCCTPAAHKAAARESYN